MPLAAAAPTAIRRPRLAYVVTHPVSADLLLRGQLAFMREQGFDVTILAAPGAALERVRDREGVRAIAVPMSREIDPRADPVSLVRLTTALRALRPDIVNAGTPKAGLLGMLAARAIGAPVRIYLLRGLRLETARGATRKILGATERIAAACAHDVVCVSRSLEKRVVEGGWVPRGKALVVGAGSSNGVDTERFRRSDHKMEEGRTRLRDIGIQPAAPVIGFVGRLVEDKGVRELLDAFELIRARVPRAVLLLVGGDLGDQVGTTELARRARSIAGVHAIPSVEDITPYYAVMNVLALPSYREGFPNVVLEAASMGVPVVGFRSTGVVDAIADGVTGAIVDQRDVGALAARLGDYLSDPTLAEETGQRARERVERSFSRLVVWRAWLALYRERLAARGMPLPSPPSSR